jgi:serine protease Do
VLAVALAVAAGAVYAVRVWPSLCYAAEKAGIQRGDVIREVDGKDVVNAQQVQNTVADLPIGKEVDVLVLRDGKKKTFKVTIAARTAEAGSTMEDYGFEVQNATPDLLRRFGIEDAEGVLVTNVRPGGPGDEAGLRPNDLIVSVQHRTVRNIEEFQKALRAADPSRGLLLLVRNRYGVRYLILKNQ